MEFTHNLFLISIQTFKNKKYLILKLVDENSNIYTVVDKNVEHEDLDIFNLYRCELILTSSERYGLRLELKRATR